MLPHNEENSFDIFVLYNSNMFFQRTGEGDEGVLEEYTNDVEEEPCYGKRCTANEHCCPGSVCVDVDGGILLFLFIK